MSEKEFIIPISYEVYSTVIVKGAKSLEEARNLVDENLDMIPLPRNPEYIDGSYKIDADSEEDLANAQDYKTRGVLMNVEDKDNIKYDVID